MRHPLYALLLLPLAGILVLVFYPRKASGVSYAPDLPGPAAVPAVYDKTTLYDYMDGGAEVYIRNGFISLKVWTGTAENAEWTVEMYLFASSDQTEKIFIKFKSDTQIHFEESSYALDKGSATTHVGVFYFKVFTYPEDNGLPEQAVQHFLRWFHEQNV
jgi:hypothetical protein